MKLLIKSIFLFLSCFTFLIFASTKVFASEINQNQQDLRLSTWYWLNSIEKEKWNEDFQVIAKSGFTDIVLCWGLDSAGVATQKNNTKFALELCQKNNLKAYLFVWHPTHNSLPRQKEFQQVDSKDNLLFTFNLFHRKWRATQWKSYLQEIASTYHSNPAFAGYVFDDTFGLGPINSFGGNEDKRGDFVSYSTYDKENFREWLKNKYQGLDKLNQAWEEKFEVWEKIDPPRLITEKNTQAWQDWTQARKEWLGEWAKDTVAFIREIDKDSSHEIYVEDLAQVLGINASRSLESFRPITIKDTIGLDFGYVMQPFDAVCGYTFFTWDNKEALEKAINTTKEVLETTRKQLGNDKKIIHTFWASELDFSKPLPLKYPSAEQITSIAKLAISLGIKHVDYYGFRIGDWRVNEEEWVKLRPGTNENYPITKPMKDRFLCDRPEVLKVLSESHKELKGVTN
ncbi:MAG: beta-galactosidase [Acidobacteria bacterium]|nr:beta-galactosidase [Acidobacteriota bacterium]